MLSILSPFYNIPPAMLDRFIHSIIDQPADDYELVIGDDGSTDETCLANLNKYEGVDHIRIVHFPHGGLSATRNRLIMEASGDYFWIADPDDIVLPKAMSIISKNIAAYPEASVFQFGYEEENSKGHIRYFIPSETTNVSKDEAWMSLSSGGSLYNGYTWNKVFNLKMLEVGDIPKFDEDLSGFEDKLWQFKMLSQLGLIVSVSLPIYRYEYNTASLSRSVSMRRRQQMMYYEAYDRILDIINDVYPNSGFYYQAVAFYFIFCWNDLFYWTFHKSEYAEERKINRNKLEKLHGILIHHKIQYKGLKLRMFFYGLLISASK